MSSYFELLGYKIVYPKIILHIKNLRGKDSNILGRLTFWCLVSSLVIGLFQSFRFLMRLPRKVYELYIKIKPLQLKNKNFALIFGFGDSLASVKLTKALISLGFDLILINRKRVFEHRRKGSINKHDDIEEVDRSNFYLSYEDIYENPDLLKNKIGDHKIYFIFDFTDFNSFGTKNEQKTGVQEEEDRLSGKFNSTLKEKRSSSMLEDNERFDGLFNAKRKEKTYSEIFGNHNDIAMENYKILYQEEMRNYLNEIIFISEYLIQFMKETKIMIFDYADRSKNLNHRLMVEFKKTLYSNLKNIARKKHNFISYVKVIDSVFCSPAKKFTEKNGMMIIRYSDFEDYEHSFA